jgi:DNA polymerase III subunit epsilon
MNYLFFDTETTGLPKDGHDARIVQLAALLTDHEGNPIADMNMIITPDGYDIPEGASAIHGITTERAIREGLPRIVVMNLFQSMVERSDMIIAHNMAFDYQCYVRECQAVDYPDAMIGKQTACTMKMATPIVQCPPTQRMIDYGRGHQYKNCTLQEAHVHFFGREFEGAHDALADVRACRDVFFAMKRMEMAA